RHQASRRDAQEDGEHRQEHEPDEERCRDAGSDPRQDIATPAGSQRRPQPAGGPNPASARRPCPVGPRTNATNACASIAWAEDLTTAIGYVATAWTLEGSMIVVTAAPAAFESVT